MMTTSRPLSLACVGCGARAQTYVQLASRHPGRFRIVAGADPVAARVDKIRRLSNNPDFRGFSRGDELLAAGKPADVVLVATQDGGHYEPCHRALELGC